MEIFVIIILFLIFFLIISGQNKSIETKLTKLDKKINVVYKELIKVTKDAPTSVIKESVVREVKPEPIKPKELEIKDIPYIVTEKPKEVKLSNEEIKLEKELEEVKLQKPIESVAKKEEVKTTVSITETTENIESKNKNKESNLESLVGENILNKIGIAILILGIGFFVKFAIDKDYINEVGRVFIGVGCSAILLGFAYFLKKSYRAFSSVLAGGAIAVLYYSITIAYQDYHLLSQSVAFIGMIVITCFSTFLAIKFNRKELAIIGLIGGFTSPFMVSGESNNYIAFFTYISVLNLGMLALAYFKKWRVINLLAYAFTILLFGGWLVTNDSDLEKSITPALIFATIFYVIFYGANLIYTLRKHENFEAVQFISLLSTTVMYFTAGMLILSYTNINTQGIFTVCLAAINLMLALYVYKDKSIDKNLFYLILSKAIVLISLFAPIQLNGNYITTFWLVETTALIWISRKTSMQIFKDIAVVVFLVSCFSLLLNLMRFYLVDFSSETTPFINQGFLTGLIALITYFTSIYLLKKENIETPYLLIKAKSFIKILKITLGAVAYLSILLELNFGIDTNLIGVENPDDIYSFYGRAGDSIKALMNYGYHFIAIGAFIVFTKRSNDDVIKLLSFIGLALLTLIFLLVGNQNSIDIRKFVLLGDINSGWLVLKYLVTVFMVVANVLFYISYIKNRGKKEDLYTFFYITTVLFTIYTISIELDYAAVLSQIDFNSSREVINKITDNVLNFTQKAGYSIAWGLSSFVFMFFGMKNKVTILRILSLILFLVTIIKLLVFDMHDMSNVARYISFIGLGILLLLVSFMYQRLRKLINEGK